MALRALIVVLCIAFAATLVIAATGDGHAGHGAHAMHQGGGGS